MSDTTDQHPTPVISDPESLAAWMDTQELGTGAPLEHGYISGGSQNEIYELRRGDLHCVMRIPPSYAPEDRDDGIYREWRIIEALDGTDVPHTEAIAVCTDKSVLGRTFYLMGYVDGWSPMETGGVWPEPFNSDLEARQGLAYELVDGIVKMGAVDWKARGLEGLGRPEGYHERQVERWTRFYDRIKGRDLEGFDVAADWLRRHKPIDYVPGIMHGDYQFANVMFRHGTPTTLAAIIDWEMGTVGDPKIDLAWVTHSWPEEPSEVGQGIASYADLSGMPTRSQLLEFYSERSGRQVDDMDYYFVLAKWKLGVVLERGFQRAGDDPKLQSFGDAVVGLIKGAAEVAESSDYAG